jgi:SAM-dependent methyltransferase
MVNPHAAENFLSKAVPRRPGIWADLGAGEGTFTRALVRIIGAASTIYAIDKDPAAVAALRRDGSINGTEIIPSVGDFTRELELPETLRGTLDGLLMANALHYVREPAPVLKRLVEWLRPGGSVVLVEYDRRRANRWVPYPIEPKRLAEIAASAGLSPPVMCATMPSRYAGTMYVARLTRPT